MGCSRSAGAGQQGGGMLYRRWDSSFARAPGADQGGGLSRARLAYEGVDSKEAHVAERGHKGQQGHNAAEDDGPVPTHHHKAQDGDFQAASPEDVPKQWDARSGIAGSAPLVQVLVDAVYVGGGRHDLRQAGAQGREDADDQREDGHPLAYQLPDDLVVLRKLRHSLESSESESS